MRPLIVFLAALLIGGAGPRESGGDDDEDPYASAREAMVRKQIENRGVIDPAVLAAMRAVPRHRFVPPEYRGQAYADYPLPIGEDQTISQPYIVAVMTELLRLGPEDRVLEIGTGSGYQAAVLGEIAAEVYSIEIVPSLGERARAVLAELGYDNVHVRVGDGYRGWPTRAPFDAVIVTAAPAKVPQPLLDQLAPGGRLVVPEGEGIQQLVLYLRRDGPDGPRFERKPLMGVRFVPMTGEVRRP
jgi:protein-L-isoaspartate(D-aspartate) O-methyltransferase